MQISYAGAEIFRTADSFLITSHAHPDGDAVGSAIGLGLALRGIGKDVSIIFARPLPASYRFLPGSELVLASNGGAEKYFSCGILLDCACRERIGEEMLWVSEHCDMMVNIDHHISNTRFGAVNIVDTKASGTGEILYRIMSDLGIGISPEVATNLYTAIVTDSGSFRHDNTTPRCHLVASMLLQLGADHNKVQQCLNEQKTLSGMRLLEKGLSTLEVEQGGKIAWMSLPLEFFKETGCALEDSDDFVNYPKSIAGVEMGILFKEIEDDEIRVGFRSKGFADVNLLAGRFGGGGHKKAAGCTIRGTLPDVEALVVGAAREYLHQISETGCC
jgi:phosphoesterase RecJ-like protein